MLLHLHNSVYQGDMVCTAKHAVRLALDVLSWQAPTEAYRLRWQVR